MQYPSDLCKQIVHRSDLAHRSPELLLLRRMAWELQAPAKGFRTQVLKDRRFCGREIQQMDNLLTAMVCFSVSAWN